MLPAGLAERLQSCLSRKAEHTSEGHWLGPVRGTDCASGSSSGTSRPKYSPSFVSGDFASFGSSVSSCNDPGLSNGASCPTGSGLIDVPGPPALQCWERFVCGASRRHIAWVMHWMMTALWRCFLPYIQIESSWHFTIRALVSNLHWCETSEVLIRKNLQLLLLRQRKEGLVLCKYLVHQPLNHTVVLDYAHRKVKFLWSLRALNRTA